jgi:hypothetical protein
MVKERALWSADDMIAMWDGYLELGGGLIKRLMENLNIEMDIPNL